jgi:hypothetical protein
MPGLGVSSRPLLCSVLFLLLALLDSPSVQACAVSVGLSTLRFDVGTFHASGIARVCDRVV